MLMGLFTWAAIALGTLQGWRDAQVQTREGKVMRIRICRWPYCGECHEPLYGDNFGTDLEPRCAVCVANQRVDELHRQGFTHEQIMALHRVWVREIDRRYAELRQGEQDR